MPKPSLTRLFAGPLLPISFPDEGQLTAGSASDALLRIEGEGVAGVHAVLEERDGGCWITPAGGGVDVNGAALSGAWQLRDHDQVRIGPAVFEFASGERRTRRMSSVADMVARPRKAASGPLPGPARNVSIGAIATVVVALILVAGAGAIAWYGLFHAGKSIVVLDDRQATELDSLLVVTYDHVERGATLLELGLGEGAGQEFARAVNTLALSDLRNNPQVKPRIEALQASVAAIYRERSLAVPGNYANATSPLTPEQMKTASLSVERFAATFALMAAAFRARFGHPIIVSGRDHAEHVILYGRGGAMDLSIKTMNGTEVQFVIDQSHARHIRVKDFSQDSVLRRQVANAVKAGLLFEAGTGLHLHIDRFANRRDRWTTLRIVPSAERLRDLVERGPSRGVGREGRRDHG